MPGFLTKVLRKRSKRSGGKANQPELWIQKLKKGTLRADVQRIYGSKGFKKVNHRKLIRPSILRILSKRKGKVGKRARAAVTLAKLRGQR